MTIGKEESPDVRNAAQDENEQKYLYDKALEFVTHTGNEDFKVLARELAITEEEAFVLIEEMKAYGDIADDEECCGNDCEDYNCETEGSAGDDSDIDENDFVEHPTEIILDTLTFIGDIVCDTGDKICEVLDQAEEKINEFFDKL